MTPPLGQGSLGGSFKCLKVIRLQSGCTSGILCACMCMQAIVFACARLMCGAAHISCRVPQAYGDLFPIVDSVSCKKEVRYRWRPEDVRPLLCCLHSNLRRA